MGAAQILDGSEDPAHERPRLMDGASSLRELTGFVRTLLRRRSEARLLQFIFAPRHGATAVGASLDAFKSRDLFVELLMDACVSAVAHLNAIPRFLRLNPASLPVDPPDRQSGLRLR